MILRVQSCMCTNHHMQYSSDPLWLFGSCICKYDNIHGTLFHAHQHYLQLLGDFKMISADITVLQSICGHLTGRTHSSSGFQKYANSANCFPSENSFLRS